MTSITTVLFVFMTVQTASADTTIIEGFDDNLHIMIVNDDTNNIVILQTDEGISIHYDSSIKTYQSGGFSMRNPESGILLFAHPISDLQYKITVLTSGQVYRLIGNVEILTDFVKEPKSSVGSDITKYDAPTPSRNDNKSSFLLTLQADKENYVTFGDKYTLHGYVYNARNLDRIEDANVTLEISRDDYVHRTVEITTGLGGTVNIEIGDISYPLFYPRFCYDVNVIVEYGNYTTVWSDDFVVLANQDWEPDMSWLDFERWSYLPYEFRDMPRSTIGADSHCN